MIKSSFNIKQNKIKDTNINSYGNFAQLPVLPLTLIQAKDRFLLF